ncbi:hypothetical protein [Raoultibacter phocaeensis]|uniref:hypothetical protein n=1 Tax=Raoultibacter phocaeensis TaxID=2479841 RepID=UPI0015D5C759|nr:hypothetical protein [Raoultibacter phocaeensis]
MGGQTESGGIESIIPSVESLAKTRGFATEVPEAFRREALAFGPFDEVLVAEGGSVVGMVCRGSAPELFARFSDELEGKGWLAVESGQECVRTFVKAQGDYTWLLLSCTQAGSWASATVFAR